MTASAELIPDMADQIAGVLTDNNWYVATVTVIDADTHQPVQIWTQQEGEQP